MRMNAVKSKNCQYLDYNEINDDIDQLIENTQSIKGNEKIFIVEEDENDIYAIVLLTTKKEAFVLMEIDKNEPVHSGRIAAEIRKYPNFSHAEWLDVKNTGSLKQNYISALEEFHVKVIVN